MRNNKQNLVKGSISQVTMDVTGTSHFPYTITLKNSETRYWGTKYFSGFLNTEDKVEVTYLLDPYNRHIIVDIFHERQGHLYTDKDKEDIINHLNLRTLYVSPQILSIESTLESIRDLELNLITYLKKHPQKMREMHPEAFEKLIAELMASFGFIVEWTGRNKETAGDVIAFQIDTDIGLKNNYIIECKRYSEGRTVGIEIARSLYGAKVDEGYSNALLATTSFFERGVKSFASRRWDFHLKDYFGLVEWLNKYRPNEEGKLYLENGILKIRSNV